MKGQAGPYLSIGRAIAVDPTPLAGDPSAQIRPGGLLARTRARLLAARAVSLHDVSAGLTRRSVGERRRQFGFVRVHDEHRQKLGALSLAGVGADVVAVARELRETLPSMIGRDWAVVDLAADRPFQHRRIYEG